MRGLVRGKRDLLPGNGMSTFPQNRTSEDLLADLSAPLSQNMAGSLFLHSYYVVNFINAMLYGAFRTIKLYSPCPDAECIAPCLGMALLLYYQTVTQMLELRKSDRTPMDKFMIGFVTVLLILNTIYWSTQVYFGEMMWITHADYPGGSDAYVSTYSSVWYQTWGTAASVISNLMSDALLVSPIPSLCPARRIVLMLAKTYRCFVIWNSKRVIVLPGLIWLSSLGAHSRRCPCMSD